MDFVLLLLISIQSMLGSEQIKMTNGRCGHCSIVTEGKFLAESKVEMSANFR